MKREKDLLLIDLCARLPYGVIIQHPDLFRPSILITEKLEEYHKGHFGSDDITFEFIKPYLRPMSSMTGKEKVEYYNLCYEEERECYEFGEWTTKLYYHDTIESIDWLNAHHFDYRSLISKGSALEAPEGMYN